MSDTTLIRSYSLLTRMLGPVSPLWIKRRARLGKEDPERADERHGLASLPRPEGRLYWCHAASVGECTMMLPLIERLLREDESAHLLMTSGTLTSAQLMAQRLPERAFHQYVPLDYPKAVNAFLDHWQPDLAIWAESEIWPNLISLTRQSGCPMVLINARMSQKSLDNWHSKGAKSARQIFSNFDLVLAADERTAKGLSWLLDRDVEMAGNLKDAAPPLPVRPDELARLKQQIGMRPVWCAASTHEGEDIFMIEAHNNVRERHPEALLILAPRHPERLAGITYLLDMQDQSYVTRTSGDPISGETSVFVIDTIGDMGLAFRLSYITFVAGSLVQGLAGHNPLEPARLSNAIMTGPHISSFADCYMEMISFDAVQRVLAPEPIGHMVADMMSDPMLHNGYMERAQSFADSRDALLDYVWDQLSPLLPGAGE